MDKEPDKVLKKKIEQTLETITVCNSLPGSVYHDSDSENTCGNSR